MQISAVESSRGFIDRNLYYHSPFWSDSTKRGQKVQKSETLEVYFTVKTNEADVSPLLELTGANGGLVWLDSSDAETMSGTATKVRAKLGINTDGKAGTHRYELRVKLADGSFITAEKGTIVIEESLTDTP
jgi:hypothetical protein